MSNPLITVITSLLNAEREIPNLINSLLIQKFQDFEWLIIDGGSTDKSLDQIKNIEKAKLICSEKDNGIYDAWNKGLKFAKGKWIIFLGADDKLYDPKVFENFYNFTKNISLETQIIYGKVYVNKNIVGEEIINLKKQIIKYMCVCHQATFHKNTLFKEVGLFNKNYKIVGDYELLVRSIVNHNKAGIFFDELVSVMGTHGISSNKNNGLIVASEMYNARIKNNIFPINTRWIKLFIASIFYKIIFIIKNHI